MPVGFKGVFVGGGRRCVGGVDDMAAWMANNEEFGVWRFKCEAP